MKGFADRTRTPLTRHGHAHRRRAVMAAHITRITLLTLLTGLTRPDHGRTYTEHGRQPTLEALARMATGVAQMASGRRHGSVLVESR